jgi:inorganic pyrophosphatase
MHTIHTSQAHPWHGISAGEDAPEYVTAYIEIVPNDGVKYEIDKESGLLKIDRPQRFSSQCPTFYGFIPQSYCGRKIAQRCAERTGLAGVLGDGDPIDICVLSEKQIPHGQFLVRAKPIGGLRMVDKNEADDKIIAVLDSDLAYGHINDVSQLPREVVDRLRHYFLTYKQLPSEAPRAVHIHEVYDRIEAQEVIRRSLADYRSDVLMASKRRVGEGGRDSTETTLSRKPLSGETARVGRTRGPAPKAATKPAAGKAAAGKAAGKAASRSAKPAAPAAPGASKGGAGSTRIDGVKRSVPARRPSRSR